jgi:hypothetical protein
MAMPKVDARTVVTVDAVPAGTFPDLALMQLLIQTNPQTLKKSADARMRPFNFEKKELGPQGVGIVRIRVEDLDAEGEKIPAVAAATAALGTLLGQLAARQQINADIAEVDTAIAALAEGADDKALQAERTGLVEELAAVETALGMK